MRTLSVSFVTTSVRSISLLSLLIASQASADLITVDWTTAGDAMLVRDTATGLEWLKLTETYGLSYADVSNRLLTGGDYAGMRFADNDEVATLFQQYFGISLTAFYGERAGVVDPGVRLASETLGDGLSDETDPLAPNANYRLVGFTSDMRPNDAPYVLGARTRFSDTDYFTTADPAAPIGYVPWDPYELVSSGGDAHAWIGSYLVRTTVVSTPLPAAVWMLGTGLIALGAFARRR